MTGSLFDLTGKTALITGSSQGLGFAIAKGLGQAGAEIVLNGRDNNKLSRAVEELRRQGIRTQGYAFDITHHEEVVDHISDIQTETGPIHILVNNAGIQRRGPIETFPLQTWREVIEVNLTSAFVVTQQVLSGMMARRSGKIINICSLVSEVSRPTIVPYTASKGGMKMFTLGLAAELGKHNIQVNGIGPGYFATEMNRPLIEDAQFNAWVCSRTPAGRWGKPDELIGTAVFLASPASDFVNGQIIYVDGGMLATL